MKIAMVSSTSLDLPEHRKEVVAACLRQSVFPSGMENLPARDADAIRVSMEMVDKADIYIGIFAWRYGHTPEPHDISITEMEFNRAVKRKIPILVFLIHKEHPLTIDMVETDKDAQKKLAELKERASKGRGRREFKSPADLRGEVIHALADLQQREQQESGEKPEPPFHPPNIIPQAPKPYIAHPYSLLQTAQVVGRQNELNLLTDWVTTNKRIPENVRLFNLVAIGGMGKSALSWKWFNDIAPHEMQNRAGWMWWSFYESDAHYENFTIRALAYASGQSEKTVRQLKTSEREDQLWGLLDEHPFVLVLDGLERILLAYARRDAPQMLDDDLDEHTANHVAHALGLPESAAQSFTGKHQLRLTADQRAGRFLRRLTYVRASRLLISTRLYPAELQADTGDPLPGCFALFLVGLTDDDALQLWRDFKVSGSREELLPLFRSFGNYPLLVRALAGEVANDRNNPRDFDKWRARNPNFNPAALPLKNAKTHVLEYALLGLDETQRQVLHTLAAFRMPANWDTLRALLVGDIGSHESQLSSLASPPKRSKSRPISYSQKKKPCANDRDLDTVLTELEDRGLVSWDKHANRYDLHPIVRSIVWQTMDGHSREGVYQELHTFFDAVPKLRNWQQVESRDDLMPAIELYFTLIELKRFEDAYHVFKSHIDEATYHRLVDNALRVDLLRLLFSTGPNPRPNLADSFAQGYVVNSLGTAHLYVGQPGLASPYFRSFIEISQARRDLKNVAIGLGNLAESYLCTGQLRHARATALEELALARQMSDLAEVDVSLEWIALTCAVNGDASTSKIASERILRIWTLRQRRPSERVLDFILATRLIWLGQSDEAFGFARSAWAKAQHSRYGRNFIESSRLFGSAALLVKDWETAAERLQHALLRSRDVNLVVEELPALSSLAELHRVRREYAAARDLLEQVWAPAERGPYPLFHADARNVLARIERDEGNRDAAIAAATRAFELAWCDGPPYAYHYGLTNAKQLLTELGATDVIAKLEAKLPPFDESKFEPMPDVEINPKDEFWVDPDTLDSDILGFEQPLNSKSRLQ